MTLRRSQRKKSNVNEKIKTMLEGDEKGLTIESYGEKGKGIKATKTFLKNDYICEYKGEVCDKKEADIKASYYLANEMGFYMFYFEFKGKHYCIDATDEFDSCGKLRVGRLINHSRKSANSTAKLIEYEEKPKIVIMANRTIKEGEEILYDYGDRSKESIKNCPWLKN